MTIWTAAAGRCEALEQLDMTAPLRISPRERQALLERMRERMAHVRRVFRRVRVTR